MRDTPKRRPNDALEPSSQFEVNPVVCWIVLSWLDCGGRDGLAPCGILLHYGLGGLEAQVTRVYVE